MTFSKATWAWIALLLVAGALSPIALRVFKNWRSDQLAEQSLNAHLENPDDSDLLHRMTLKANAAHRVAPDRFKAQRTLGLLLLRSSPEQSRSFWEKATETDPAQMQQPDWLAYVQCLILCGDLQQAENILDQHLHEKAGMHGYQMSKIRLLQGRHAEALKLAEASLNHEPVDLRTLLHFASMAFQFGDTPARASASKHLLSQLESTPPPPFEAMEAIARLPGTGQSIRESCAKALRQVPAAPIETRLLLADLEIELQQSLPIENWNQLLETASPMSDEQCIQIGNWGLRHNLSTEVTRLIPKERAAVHKNLFLIRLKALSRSDQWDALLHELENRQAPLTVFWRHLLLAEAHLNQNSNAQATTHWQRAANESPVQADAQWELIRLGMRIGNDEKMNQLFAARILDGEADLVQTFLVQRLAISSNHPQMLSSLAWISSQFPQLHSWRNDWAYHALLLGVQREKAMQVASALSTEFPQKLSYHMTWAMGAVQEGRHREVLERLRHFKLDWETLPLPWRIILALALEGVGERETALHYVSDLNPDTLNPWERKLATPLIAAPSTP
jgi:tetratricopeptide (TPR) repeat protein